MKCSYYLNIFFYLIQPFDFEAAYARIPEDSVARTEKLRKRKFRYERTLQMKKSVLCASMLVILFAAGAALAASFSSEKGGFSIDLPDGWDPMPKEQLDAMEASGTYLMAMDQKAIAAGKSLTMTGMKVTVPETAKSASIKDFTSTQAEQIKAVPNIKGDVKSEVTKFGGLEWSKLAYSMDAGGITIFMGQYTAFSGDSMFTFTFTGSDASADEPIFDKSMETFKLK
jgi:hypothetical protein